MKINNIYWYFKGVLSKRFCEELIQYGKQKEDKIALTGGLPNVEDLSKKQLKDLKKKRDSNIVWMGEQWIFKEILPYVNLANKNAGWNFDWDYSEDCQFTKYTEGQFYNWHQDSFDKPFNNPNKLMLHNKIRKLSVTCSLSDPST